MAATITNEMRKTLTKDGSVLKRLRSAGGLPFALLASGILLLVIAALMGIPLLIAGMAGIALALAGAFVIPGLILVIYGIIAYNKRVQGYLAYYQKTTGLKADDLKLADREILEPGTVLISHPLKGKRGKDYSLGCFITKHFLVAPFPGGTCYLRQIKDLAAVIYTNEIPGINGCISGVVFLSENDPLPSYDASLTKDECMEIISIIKEKNPKTITDQRFFYKEKQYDIIKDYKEVARLFKEVNG